MTHQDTPQWDKEGGAAFPIPASDLSGSYEPEPGMSLRDYFAAKAMAAFNSNPNSWHSSTVNDKAIAEMAYRQADAMLAERDKQAEPQESASGTNAAIAIALKAMEAGVARIESNTGFSEFCFNGICVVIRNGDLASAVDHFGREQIKQAIDSPNGKRP